MLTEGNAKTRIKPVFLRDSIRRKGRGRERRGRRGRRRGTREDQGRNWEETGEKILKRRKN